MNTYFLTWDGGPLSFNYTDMKGLLWQFYEHSIPWPLSSSKIGERFYLYCDATKSEGIVGRGYIVTNTANDCDWYGLGKDTDYVYLGLEVLINPQKIDTLKEASLDLRLPPRNNEAVFSNYILDERTIKLLDNVWADYINNLPSEIYDTEKTIARRFPEKYLNIWKKLHNID